MSITKLIPPPCFHPKWTIPDDMEPCSSAVRKGYPVVVVVLWELWETPSVFQRGVFQALWERWENRFWFFHGFHSAAVSTAGGG
jgi:hypothetical protein